jgi:MYXO-CTERM domain-containing protein
MKTPNICQALSTHSEKRLASYALAAVGAGALAAIPAKATEIFPIDVTLTETSGPQLVPLPGFNMNPFEFEFESGGLLAFVRNSFFQAVYDRSNGGFLDAIRFTTGQTIGSSQGYLAASGGLMAGRYGGQWIPAAPGDTVKGFLGVNMFIDGFIENAWLRTTVFESTNGGLTVHADEWGLASNFSSPVIAGSGQTFPPTPEPGTGSLALLALGAAGLLELRRRRLRRQRPQS